MTGPLATVTVDFPAGTRDVSLWPGEAAHERALGECAASAPLLSTDRCFVRPAILADS